MSFNMDKIALTDEQSRRILELWNNPDSSKIPGIKELTGIIFPDVSEEMKDGRSVYGRTIRAFLAERNLKARATSEYQAKERVDLSDEQKEFILKNVSTMSSVELARTLFKNETLTNLNIEARIVNDYIKTLSNIVVYSTTEEVPDGEYRPPKTPDRILARINKYILDGIDKDRCGVPCVCLPGTGPMPRTGLGVRWKGNGACQSASARAALPQPVSA